MTSALPPPAAVLDLLRDPARLSMVFQPIADLQRGVVAGYEALARVAGPVQLSPDVWFAAAARDGLLAVLEARTLRLALAARTALPRNTFLTVNCSPLVLDAPEVRAVLSEAGDLQGMILELTEHDRVDDHDGLLAQLEPLRAAGAGIAVDDAGSGYSGLHRLAVVRPQLVKLDRALVSRADRDEAKLALAEALGNLAGRLDAWLLVEGVERDEELEAFTRLGVPLAQGYLLGRPAAPWAELPPDVVQRIRMLSARARLVEHVASLIERAPALIPADHHEAADILAAERDTVAVVQLDADRRPLRLVLPNRRADDPPGRVRAVTAGLRVQPSEDVRDVAKRAMTRGGGERFDPLVCIDPEGRYVGLVLVERLLLRLADLK